MTEGWYPMLPRGAVVSLKPGHHSVAKIGDRVLAATFLVAMRTVSLTNQREHWTKRHKRAAEQRRIVRMVIGNRLRSLVPCNVRLTRIAPRRLDDDNLRGALKSVRDAVAKAMGVDDGSTLVGWDYEQTPGPYAVRIEVRT